MYKKSFFRGLGTGLIVGALTVTVAFNFDNAGKNDSGQGSQANVIQQETSGTTEKTPDQSNDTEDKGTTEKNTTEKNTTEKNTTEKSTTEKSSSANDGTDNGKSDVNGKGDVYLGGGKDETPSSGSSDNSKDGTSSSDSSDNSKDGTSSSNSPENSAGDNGGLSNNTQRVPSSKDNGYTEDKNSHTGGASSTDKNSDKTEPATEASTEAVKASAIKYDNGGGEITFGSNTSAYEICQLLAQIGLRDADEYYDWLLRSGYSASLVPGTYTFSGNETNGGIVWILLGNQ